MKKLFLASNFRVNLVLLFSSLILFIILAEIGLRIFNFGKHQNILAHHVFHEYDPDIGWICAPDNLHLSINRQGIRAVREFPIVKNNKIPRVALLGDSMIFGLGLPYRDTISAKLESMINVEVLNFGVPGYGTDQALLRYRKSVSKFRLQYVCIAVSLCNDTINNYYDIQYGARKPRFKLVNGKCILLKRPVSSFWYMLDLNLRKSSRIYNMIKMQLIKLEASKQLSRFNYDVGDRRFSEALKLTDALLDTFISEVLQNESIPIVIILPFRDQYTHRRAYEHPLYFDVLKICKKRNLICIDGLRLLNDDGQLWKDRFHLSAIGSEIIAQAISRAIEP